MDSSPSRAANLQTPCQLGLQGHDRQYPLRYSRNSGQQPGLKGQQIGDKKVVLLQPGSERALG